MSTYRIVVGVDGSDGGDRALRWAVREAAARGGTVQAVIAWNWDAVDPTGLANLENPRERAQHTLAAATAAALTVQPGVTVANEVVNGYPAQVLVDAAADADLLVLGSHGHGRVFHAVLGSVAEECIHAASCPVVVVPVPRPPHAQNPLASQATGEPR
jgi:nucleotide-binding universal stress UspA family protein